MKEPVAFGRIALANIATVMVHGRNELHLKFNNDADLREAYAEITKREPYNLEARAKVEAHFGLTEAQARSIVEAAHKRPAPTTLHSLVEKWRGKLREVGGADNSLVNVPAGGVSAMLDEFAALPNTSAPASEAQPGVSYVHLVPDHCDRIAWRDRYYSLPLAAPAGEAQPEQIGYVKAIDVEKLLCTKLGIDWSPTGTSIVSLIDRLGEGSSHG